MHGSKRMLLIAVLFLLFFSCTSYAAQNIASLRKAAERGDTNAQIQLGLAYENGTGVKRNYQEAVKWYRKAAEQDDVTAQRLLGICFYKGRGVKKNYQRAAEWLRKSLNHDSFALDDDKDYKKAEKFFADKNYQKAAQLYQHIWQEWEDMTM